MSHAVFDPNIHCGAPARRRNTELLTKAIRRATGALKALKPYASRNYDSKRAHYQKVIDNSTALLAELEKEPDDRPCCNQKGKATDHKGEGFCFAHCHCHGKRGWHSNTGSPYRHIEHRKLQEALNLVENQTADIMDLVPEAKLLKAATVVFFEDAKRRKEFTPEDVKAAAMLIDKTGKMIERINAIRMKTGLVTMEAIYMLTSEMGRLLLAEAAASNAKNSMP